MMRFCDRTRLEKENTSKNIYCIDILNLPDLSSADLGFETEVKSVIHLC